MLPAGARDLEVSLNLKEKPNRTFALQREAGRLIGFNDGKAAIAQAIYLILSVERGQWGIYGPDYGIELDDIFGKSKEEAIALLPDRISEALLWDSRIKDVGDFKFTGDKDRVSVSFTAQTVFGALEAEKEFLF